MLPTELPALTSPPRVVLFFTHLCAADIPVTEPTLACLLPLGHATFAERILDSCSRAGLRQVDLVVSEQPERLRQRLGEGWPWGLQLNWHLAKDTTTPYGLLRALNLRPGQRVLMGHGHSWLAHQPLRALALQNQTAVAEDRPDEWLGWASLDAKDLQLVSQHADEDLLADVVMHGLQAPITPIASSELARAGSVQDLLQAQQQACSASAWHHLPATWRRYPWGAASPDANVHARADITGPVLIGPRCLVAADAILGPGVVLSHDVLVAGGAVVRDALVLPNTYISASVTLDHVVVQGNVLQDLKWSARTTLPAGEGLLDTLQPQATLRPSASGRLLAALLALLLLPVAALLQLRQAWRKKPLGWRVQAMVVGRTAPWNQPGQLLLRPLRMTQAQAGTGGWLLARYGALLDVAQGARHWFGIRPRNEAQWYALRRDWQQLFITQPVGFFHAPGWVDPSTPFDSEALAAADAYFTVQIRLVSPWRLLRQMAQSFSIRQTRA